MGVRAAGRRWRNPHHPRRRRRSDSGQITAWVGVVGLGVVVFSVFSLYFIPTIIAVARGHRQILAIGMLNTLVGWTFVGWVIALVWACTRDP